MANEFKNAFKTGYAQTTLHTTNSLVLSTDSNAVLIQLDIATSKDDGASPAVGVSVAICESDATVKAYLIRNVAIPEGTTLSILRGQKLVLTSDTYLHVIVTSGDEIDITCSYLEAVGG